MTIIERYLNRQNILVIDGALGTELARRGCDINHPIWSAKLLAENPEAIAGVHTDYLEAGADCLITASYQATYEGFTDLGMSWEEAGNLIASAVGLARDCVETFWAREANQKNRLKPLVAASVGPYGAFLADGSEFRGDYGKSEEELMAFHEKRLSTLIRAEPDLLAFETLPCLVEAKALVRLLKDFPSMEAWVSFSARDGLKTNSGDLIRDCAQWLGDKDQIAAVGINCTAPEHIPSLIREIQRETDKPIIVYPNRGGKWDALSKTFHLDASTPSFAQMAGEWAEAGAALMGGCCETTPDDIRGLSTALKQAIPAQG